MDFAYVVAPAMLVAIGSVVAWLAIRRMRSPGAASLPSSRKITERAALSVVAIAAVLTAGSSGWNAIALYLHRHPPPGEMYRVDGHEMRIQCMGSGSPAIVLDAGLGNDGLIWSGVQPALAKTTR